MPLIKPTAENLAYIAGLFDGEGCVSFSQVGQNKTWAIRAFITNTNLEVLEWVQGFFGGRIQPFHSKKEWKVGHHLIFAWDNAIAFLQAIDPWLIIKKEQAQVAFTWDIIRNRSSKRPPDDGCLDLLVAQLRWLNKKGIAGQKGSDPMTTFLQREWGTLLPDEYIKENFKFVEEDVNASYR